MSVAAPGALVCCKQPESESPWSPAQNQDLGVSHVCWIALKNEPQDQDF